MRRLEALRESTDADAIAAQVMGAGALGAVGAIMGSHEGGGMRVMVPESQLEQATRIREKFDAGDYAIDESFDPDAD